MNKLGKVEVNYTRTEQDTIVYQLSKLYPNFVGGKGAKEYYLSIGQSITLTVKNNRRLFSCAGKMLNKYGFETCKYALDELKDIPSDKLNAELYAILENRCRQSAPKVWEQRSEKEKQERFKDMQHISEVLKQAGHEIENIGSSWESDSMKNYVRLNEQIISMQPSERRNELVKERDKIKNRLESNKVI